MAKCNQLPPLPFKELINVNKVVKEPTKFAINQCLWRDTNMNGTCQCFGGSICASYTELKLRWAYHIPAGQNSVHAHHIPNDTGLQLWRSLNPVGRLSCVECITHAFMTSVTSRHIWLKSGRSFTRWPLIGRSSSGVGEVVRFLKRRTLQTSAVVWLFITDHM